MSDTPETDKFTHSGSRLAEHARGLEKQRDQLRREKGELWIAMDIVREVANLPWGEALPALSLEGPIERARRALMAIRTVVPTAAGPMCNICGRGVQAALSPDVETCQCERKYGQP